MSKPKKDIVQVLDHTNAYMCTIELDRLCVALSHIGLHIVTEAEKRVLDACEAEAKAKNYIERHQAAHARGVAVALMLARRTP